MTPASIFGALSQSNYGFHDVQISDWDKAVELGQMEPKSLEVAFGQNPTIFHLMGRESTGMIGFHSHHVEGSPCDDLCAI
jgi:hypothetical protein